MRKQIAVLLTLVLLMGMTLQVQAAERSNGSLISCDISVSSASNGVRITITTKATASASQIGAKNVVLQENVNGTWKNINISGGYDTNTDTYSGSTTYTSAIKGRSYRVSCTHYAVFSSGTKTLNNTSGSIVFN